MSLYGSFLRWGIERQAQTMSLDELKRWLQESGERISDKFARASNNRLNQEAAKHVIGIERWGQRRLCVLLGEPPIQDEYNSYRPDDLNDIKALCDAFKGTRAETLTVIDRLKAAGVAPDRTTFHNQYGDLSVRGWLRYLNDHAIRETLWVR